LPAMCFFISSITFKYASCASNKTPLISSRRKSLINLAHVIIWTKYGVAMIGKEHSEPNAVSMPEALSILEERKKEGELGYEQEITYEHVKKFAKLGRSDAEKMAKELSDFGISKKGIAKIIDIMPISVLQLKQVLIIERRNFDEDVIAKIFETIEKYRKR